MYIFIYLFKTNNSHSPKRETESTTLSHTRQIWEYPHEVVTSVQFSFRFTGVFHVTYVTYPGMFKGKKADTLNFRFQKRRKLSW